MRGLKKYVAENSDKVERIVSRVETAGLLVTMIAVVMLTKKNHRRR